MVRSLCTRFVAPLAVSVFRHGVVVKAAGIRMD
jgi:hypothetical protein